MCFQKVDLTRASLANKAAPGMPSPNKSPANATASQKAMLATSSTAQHSSGPGTPNEVVLPPKNTPTPPKGTGGSPRRQRSDTPNKKSPKDKKSGENIESFDARLKSIITNALIGGEAPDAKGKEVAPGKPEGKNHVLPCGAPLLDYHDISPSRPGAPKPGELEAAGEAERLGRVQKMESAAALGLLSLPVKISLHDSQAANPPGMMASADKRNRDGRRRRSGSPAREAYSPLSRPSSSSSTASAESIRHLTHGTASPRQGTFQLDSLIPDSRRSPATKMPPPPRSSSAASDSAPPPLTPPHMAPPKMSPTMGPMPPVSMPGYPAGYPGLGASMLGVPPHGYPPHMDKEALQHLSPGSKHMMHGLPYSIAAAQHGSQVFFPGYHPPVNGITKSLADDDKPKKGRRKRASPASGAKSPPGLAAKRSPPPHMNGPTSKNCHPPGKPPGKGGPHPGDIANMVSNASQPLAIQPISDAESSKSSPLPPSPSKLPPHLLKEHPGEHCQVAQSYNSALALYEDCLSSSMDFHSEDTTVLLSLSWEFISILLWEHLDIEMSLSSLITLKFGIEHNSVTAMLCAKFQNDWTKLRVNEISWDLSRRWLSDGYQHMLLRPTGF